MEIKILTEKDRENFDKVSVHPLQSWAWGDFRAQTGNKIVRLGLFEKEKLIAGVQVIFSKIPHTKLTIGTVIKGIDPTPQLLKYLTELGHKEAAIFIKLEPNVLKNPKTEKTLKKSGCLLGKRLFTPTTFWLDLRKSEQELLASFTSKTRYNIKLATKKGVIFKVDNSSKAFKKYLALTKETTQRQGFYAHSQKYHQAMWETLNPAGIAHLLTATFQKEIITTWIVFIWNGFLYYPYGASTEKFKNVMANNLMMWEAIKFGKEKGLKTFDLWGREEGKGFTKFKEGYSPKVVEFSGSWDLPTSSYYPAYRSLERLRWAFLRFKTKLVKPSF
jgi:lipid II:glycine glycyltransferase (peptidoglycan interpeptide bridge formation enzyme)